MDVNILVLHYFSYKLTSLENKCSLCSLRCVQLQVHAQTQRQVSSSVQFIAYAKSWYFHALFCYYHIFPVRRNYVKIRCFLLCFHFYSHGPHNMMVYHVLLTCSLSHYSVCQKYVSLKIIYRKFKM